MGNRKKLLQFLLPDPPPPAAPTTNSSSSSTYSDSDDDASCSPSTSATTPSPSPYAMSPWTTQSLPGLGADDDDTGGTGLLGSLVKEDGHVYSLAVAGDLLYTGTDSRNVRVWRDRRQLEGLRSGSGLVKAIVVAGDVVYTGHQDGKVRVWRRCDDGRHRRVGSLPRVRDVVASTILPSSSARELRHADAVSCLSLDAAAGLLYSGSWDRTVKVWRVSNSRCLETLYPAHDDAVNAVAAAGFDALLFTGSADGAVKVWRRERFDPTRKKRGTTRHAVERVLRQGGGAVTAIAVAAGARVVYVGSSDGAVTHWQFPRRGGAPRSGGMLRGHKMAVLCLAVAGRVVVAGSADRTVSVWRREEGADHVRLAVLSGHTGPVKCISVNDDEEEGNGGRERRWVVYSGSLDGSVKVWRVSDIGSSPGLNLMPPQPAWKPRSPLVGAWTPYAAASEPKRVVAA